MPLQGKPLGCLCLRMRTATRMSAITLLHMKQRMQQVNGNTQVEYGQGCKGYAQAPESFMLQTFTHRISAFAGWITLARSRVYMPCHLHKQNELNTQ